MSNLVLFSHVLLTLYRVYQAILAHRTLMSNLVLFSYVLRALYHVYTKLLKNEYV